MPIAQNPTLRVGLIGYGTAGAIFHAPLINATPATTLAAIVTGDPAKAQVIGQRYPQADVVPNADALWAIANTLDLVVIAAPNARHAPLAHAALAAGISVVIDKPLATSSQEAQAVIDDAAKRDLALTVFHNRRWDADFLTVERLIKAGTLGLIRRFESRFERWRPDAKPGWKRQPDAAGGMLFDLGSHLIDQALMLFGDVRCVYAELDPRYDGSTVDDDSFVALTHVNGVRSHLWMSSVAGQLGPRFRVLGSEQAYVSYGLDPQEAALGNGDTPDTAGFGGVAQDAWGCIGTEDDKQRLASRSGRYGGFYPAVATALQTGAELPVAATDALRGLKIIETAQQSAAEGRVIDLAP